MVNENYSFHEPRIYNFLQIEKVYLYIFFLPLRKRRQCYVATQRLRINLQNRIQLTFRNGSLVCFPQKEK